MEILRTIWQFFSDEGNQKAVTSVLGFMAALGAVFLYFTGRLSKLVKHFSGKKETAGESGSSRGISAGDAGIGQISGGHVTVQHGTDIIKFLEETRRREDQVRADLEGKSAAEKALLQSQIDELEKRQANPEAALAERDRRIADLEARLGNTGTADEQAARAALERDDFEAAREVFERLSAAQDLAVTKKADAEYALGQIAEEQVRWVDAARHFAAAAKLVPEFTNLLKAVDYAERSGDYASAHEFGVELMAAAVHEFGEISTQHASGLNLQALTLQATGEYAQAEQLFQQALIITAKTLGEAHQAYASRLNNLALLLKVKGDYVQAEVLYRRAIAIEAKTVGKEHPDYATSLNNLAVLLKAMGEFMEAEPLYRQALKIGAKTLGEEHPEYAKWSNNFAGLLQAMGNYEQAERLYRHAVAVLERSLGPEHPVTVGVRENLAGLLAERE